MHVNSQCLLHISWMHDNSRSTYEVILYFYTYQSGEGILHIEGSRRGFFLCFPDIK